MIGIVVAILIIGGGAYAFMSGAADSILSGVSKPTALKNAFEKTLDQETATLSAKVDLAGKSLDSDGNPQEMDLHIIFNGTVGAASEEPRPSQGSLQVDGEVAGSEVSVSAEYRRLPPRTYFLLGGQSILEGMPFDLSALTGKWLYADDVGGSDEAAMPLPIDLSCDRDEEAVQKYLESIDPEDAFLAIVDKGLIEITEPDGDSEKATLLSLTLNDTRIQEIQKEAARLGGCEDTSPVGDSDVKIETLEVAIGEKSGLIRSVLVSGMVAGEEETTFSAEFILSDFGEEPTVNAPADAKSLEDAMTDLLFGEMFTDDLFGTMPEGSEGWDDTMTEDDLADLMKELEDFAAEMEAEFGTAP